MRRIPSDDSAVATVVARFASLGFVRALSVIALVCPTRVPSRVGRPNTAAAHDGADRPIGAVVVPALVRIVVAQKRMGGIFRNARNVDQRGIDGRRHGRRRRRPGPRRIGRRRGWRWRRHRILRISANDLSVRIGFEFLDRCERDVLAWISNAVDARVVIEKEAHAIVCVRDHHDLVDVEEGVGRRRVGIHGRATARRVVARHGQDHRHGCRRVCLLLPCTGTGIQSVTLRHNLVCRLFKTRLHKAGSKSRRGVLRNQLVILHHLCVRKSQVFGGPPLVVPDPVLRSVGVDRQRILQIRKRARSLVPVVGRAREFGCHRAALVDRADVVTAPGALLVVVEPKRELGRRDRRQRRRRRRRRRCGPWRRRRRLRPRGSIVAARVPRSRDCDRVGLAEAFGAVLRRWGGWRGRRRRWKAVCIRAIDAAEKGFDGRGGRRERAVVHGEAIVEEAVCAREHLAGVGCKRVDEVAVRRPAVRRRAGIVGRRVRPHKVAAPFRVRADGDAFVQRDRRQEAAIDVRGVVVEMLRELAPKVARSGRIVGLVGRVHPRLDLRGLAVETVELAVPHPPIVVVPSASKTAVDASVWERFVVKHHKRTTVLPLEQRATLRLGRDWESRRAVARRVVVAPQVLPEAVVGAQRKGLRPVVLVQAVPRQFHGHDGHVLVAPYGERWQNGTTASESRGVEAERVGILFRRGGHASRGRVEDVEILGATEARIARGNEARVAIFSAQAFVEMNVFVAGVYEERIVVAVHGRAARGRRCFAIVSVERRVQLVPRSKLVHVVAAARSIGTHADVFKVLDAGHQGRVATLVFRSDVCAPKDPRVAVGKRRRRIRRRLRRVQGHWKQAALLVDGKLPIVVGRKAQLRGLRAVVASRLRRFHRFHRHAVREAARRQRRGPWRRRLGGRRRGRKRPTSQTAVV